VRAYVPLETPDITRRSNPPQRIAGLSRGVQSYANGRLGIRFIQQQARLRWGRLTRIRTPPQKGPLLIYGCGKLRNRTSFLENSKKIGIPLYVGNVAGSTSGKKCGSNTAEKIPPKGVRFWRFPQPLIYRGPFQSFARSPCSRRIWLPFNRSQGFLPDGQTRIVVLRAFTANGHSGFLPSSSMAQRS
jgi:hypothetical protein